MRDASCCATFLICATCRRHENTTGDRLIGLPRRVPSATSRKEIRGELWRLFLATTHGRHLML